MDEQITNLQPVIKTLKIILGAMTFGIVAFTIVSIAIAPVSPEITTANILMIALAAWGVLLIIAWPIARSLIIKQFHSYRQANPDDRECGNIPQTLLTLSIIPAAMAEGFSLFGIVIFLLIGKPVLLAAPALGLVAIFMIFPTTQRVSSLVDELSSDPQQL